MIKPEQVPKEVIVELLAALNSCDCDDCTSVAIAAAINAWPHMHLHEWQLPCLGGMSGADIMLPLPEAPQGRIAKQEEARDE